MTEHHIPEGDDPMTVTAEHDQTERAEEPLMPASVREEAEALIRELAAVAGDSAAIYKCLQSYCRGQSTENVMGGLAAAMVLIFAECITTPTEAGEYAPVSLPVD